MGSLQTEQVATKEDLLNQIQALRLVTIQKALKTRPAADSSNAA